MCADQFQAGSLLSLSRRPVTYTHAGHGQRETVRQQISETLEGVTLALVRDEDGGHRGWFTGRLAQPSLSDSSEGVVGGKAGSTSKSLRAADTLQYLRAVPVTMTSILAI